MTNLNFLRLKYIWHLIFIVSAPDAIPELRQSKFLGITLDKDGLIAVGRVNKYTLIVFLWTYYVTFDM